MTTPWQRSAWQCALNMVPEMLCMGLCMGGIPLYAYAYGARNGARVKEARRTGNDPVRGDLRNHHHSGADFSAVNCSPWLAMQAS